jgi:endonuclease/exonuclease/phosphatase family metal-dependent hydrolase
MKIRPKSRLVRLGALAALLVLAVLTFLLNVSLPGRRVQGCLQGCADRDESPGASLRILSLNVLHGHPDFERLPERLSFIAAEIERLGIDIALLQDVPWTPELKSGAAYLADRTVMNSAYLRANGNRWLIRFEEGEVVLSRYPLVFVEHSELKPAVGFFENRVVLHAVALAPSGELDLYVTHLTNGAAQVNQEQANALLEYVSRTAQHTALVAGDFNALEDSPQIRTLSQVWGDAYRTVHPELPGYTCCIDDLFAQHAELSRRIDYVFIVPKTVEALKVSQVRVIFDQPERFEGGWLWASDHAGVLVEIEY